MTTPTRLPDPPYSARERATTDRIRAAGASAAVSPGAILTAATATGTFTVKGATLGDFVQLAYGATLQGCSLSGYVNDGDSVTWVITNNTGGTITPAAATVINYVVLFGTQGQSDGL